MGRTETRPDRPGKSWKERLERFLSRIPRVRIPFRKPRAPAIAGPKAAERRAPASPSPARDAPRPALPPAVSPAPRPVRQPAPVLVLAEGGGEASLEGETPPAPLPSPEIPRAIRGESSVLPAPPARPAPASLPDLDPAAGRAPPGGALRARDAFVPFSQSRISLLALDPYRAVACWDALPAAVEAARRRVADASARLAVCFHEISLVDFDGSNANETIEVIASGPSGNHYLNVWSSGKCFVADLIVRTVDGRFAMLARSNFIELPRDAESHRYEDRRRRVLGTGSPLWRPRAIPEAAGPLMERVAEAALASEDDSFEDAAAGLPGAPRAGAEGAAGTEAVHATASLDPLPAIAGEDAGETPSSHEARIRLETGGPSSWVHGLADPGRAAGVGTSSLERPALHEEPHLEVKADLVIYGRTRPGTEVVIDGVQVPVRADGTFDLRFALPRVVEPASQPRAPLASRARRRAPKGEP